MRGQKVVKWRIRDFFCISYLNDAVMRRFIYVPLFAITRTHETTTSAATQITILFLFIAESFAI